MAIQYAVIEGVGCRLIGWDWQFDNDTFDADISCSYCVWFVPGTGDVTEN